MMKCELPSHLTSIEEFEKSVASALSLEEKSFIKGIKEENFLKIFYTIWVFTRKHYIILYYQFWLKSKKCES